ncbi:MAG TPA: exosortase A [Gammaproteobacteria bacterium]|nr:exosortase A [Gammaproteobacteria bacterium]
MKIESELVISAPLNPPAQRRTWLLATVVTTLAMVWLVMWYAETLLSIVAIWKRSETFAHGFLIFPISAYLVWTRRTLLAKVTPRPDYLGLLIMGGLGFGWLFADLGGVLVVAQYCLVAMIPATVWAVLGPQVVRAIAFPLGFLFFAVPAGEFLIPYMMNFTADFVVAALQLSGIPVYREGTFFTIPSGQWSVVEGCSGLRYLIASFTLGCLYAYLTYRSTRRRLIFALLSLIVPIVANWLRAYMIVMIAHLSDMRLALGIDHYIYGWVFFGIVMMLLFWVGSFWREDLQAPLPEGSGSVALPIHKPAQPGRFFIAGITALAVAALWPAYAMYLESAPVKTQGLVIELPDTAGGWSRQATPIADWQPHYIGTDAQVMQTYGKDGKTVSVYLGYYRTQRQNAELINSQNYMIKQKHPVWSNVGEGTREISLSGGKATIQQTLLRAPAQRLLIWSWNRLAGTNTVNPYLAKLLLAKSKLLGQHDDGAAIVIAAPYAVEESPEKAASVLQAFVQDMLPTIQKSLGNVSQQ